MFLTKGLNAAHHPYLFGKGGRISNNAKPQGLTISSLRHHTALMPLFVIMSCGMVFVTAFVTRYLE